MLWGVLRVNGLVHRGAGKPGGLIGSNMLAACLSVIPMSSKPSSKTCFRIGSISNLKFSPALSVIVWFGRSAVNE